MKLCKDCKFHTKVKGTDICTKSVQYRDFVRGDHSYMICSNERRYGDACGEAGKLFEPKSILRRLFG